MSTINKLAASAVVLPMLVMGVVAANPAGQIEGGNIYRVRNVTKNTDFTDPATADACDTVQFKVRIHNPGPDALTGVRAQATLNTEVSTSHSSTMTVSADNANPTSTSDTAGVNLSSAQSMSYVSGSTQLLDAHDTLITTLPDGILSGGVSVPNGVGVSTEQMRFVQFEAKVGCPTPEQPVYTCDLLDITAGDNRTVKISKFNVTAKNGATFKNADINWGDNNSDNGVNPVVGKTHSYSQDGTYTIAATAHFDVNGQDKTAGGVACEKQVTFTTGQPPKVTPPTPTPSTPAAPTQLVNTGAGNVAAVAAGATLAGALGYRRFLSRRLAK